MPETSSELDRISELPDLVRRQILSLLTTREAISTSLLSKAWKDEWLHLPCLDLGEKFFEEIMGKNEFSICNERKKLFLDKVDQVLTTRTQTLIFGNWSSLRKLCLYMPFIRRLGEFYSRLDRWLDYAIGSLKIKELEITCTYYADMYELPKHIMKAAYSLTSLSLTYVKLDQDTIDIIASNCSLLEFLSFQECLSESSLFKLSSFNKLLEVQVHRWVCNLSSRFQIDSATLQTFSFSDYDSVYPNLCEIDVVSCLGLKNLKISGTRLTHDSLSRHLAHLSNLQELGLEYCQFLTYVKISNHGLKDLSVRYMNELVGVEIDAVNLKNFTYSQRTDHRLPVFTFKDFNSERTTVNLRYGLETLWDDKIIKFFGQLDQCSRYLKTSVTVDYDATTMRYFIEQKFPPLYHVKHLTMKSSDIQSYAASVDDLLWLFPRLEMVLFRSPPSLLGRKPLMLKLKYKGEADDQENCGHCWWHQLLEVTIANMEGAKKDIASLKAFFEDKRAKDKITVHVVDKDKSE